MRRPTAGFKAMNERCLGKPRANRTNESRNAPGSPDIRTALTTRQATKDQGPRTHDRLPSRSGRPRPRRRIPASDGCATAWPPGWRPAWCSGPRSRRWNGGSWPGSRWRPCSGWSPSVGAPVRTYLAAWAGGLVFWILAVPWLRLIGPGAWIGWVVLGAVFSLWWPLFLALARWARFRLGVPLILAAPIAWVTVEYLRAYFLTGFPWYYLAHSQYRFLHVIQIADVTGSLGVSLLIAMVNAWLVELVTIPLLRPDDRAGPRLTLGQSARLWADHDPGGDDPLLRRLPALDGPVPPGPRVALLQSNLVQGQEEPRPRQDPSEDFRALIRRAMASDPRPDLIVWPETAYPFSFVMDRPGPGPGHLRSPGRRRSPAWRAHRAGRMAGQAEGRRRGPARDDRRGRRADAGRLPGLGPRAGPAPSSTTTALLFQPSRPDYEFYHKMHLVPFGEFIPLIDMLPWLAASDPLSRQDPLARASAATRGSSSWARTGSRR